jgi:hypothetical protein
MMRSSYELSMVPVVEGVSQYEAGQERQVLCEADRTERLERVGREYVLNRLVRLGILGQGGHRMNSACTQWSGESVRPNLVTDEEFYVRQTEQNDCKESERRVRTKADSLDASPQVIEIDIMRLSWSCRSRARQPAREMRESSS